MMGAGYYSRLIERDVKGEGWYAAVMGAGGDRVILPPHMDPLLEQTSIIVKDKRYVSLVRTFRDALLSTQGIIEVEQYCDTLLSELDLLNGTSGSFFLFDDAWNQLYPYDGSPADPAPFRRLAGQAATGWIRGPVRWRRCCTPRPSATSPAPPRPGGSQAPR